MARSLSNTERKRLRRRCCENLVYGGDNECRVDTAILSVALVCFCLKMLQEQRNVGILDGGSNIVR